MTMSLDLVKDICAEASDLYDAGRFSEGLARIDEALHICRRTPALKPPHHAPLMCVVAKAWLLHGVRRESEADAVMEQAVAAARSLASLDPEHALVGLMQAADYQKTRTNWPRAGALWADVTALSAEPHGREHPRYFQILARADQYHT